MAQGYVHAQERLWQMEVWRHISAGRLSELFGKSTLDQDRFIRTLGWRQAAERDLEALSEEARAAVDAYTDGVNAYIDGHAGGLGTGVRRDGAPERDRRHRRLRRRAVDRPRLGRLAEGPGWQLGGNFDSEVFRMLADARLGDPALTDALFPAYRADMPVITPTAAGTAARPDRRRRAVRTDGGTDGDPAAPPITAGRGRGVARRRIDRRRVPSPGRASTAATGSRATTRSARTTGSWAVRRAPAAARSSPTTRISASRCRRSGS